jgi:hypothetical protein
MEKSKITELVERDDHDMNTWGIHITCPYCKGGYTHFESVSTKETDNYDAWQGRGGAARIAMYCEQCPNPFYVRVGEHKGFSYLDVDISDVTAKLHDAR